MMLVTVVTVAIVTVRENDYCHCHSSMVLGY